MKMGKKLRLSARRKSIKMRCKRLLQAKRLKREYENENHTQYDIKTECDNEDSINTNINSGSNMFESGMVLNCYAALKPEEVITTCASAIKCNHPHEQTCLNSSSFEPSEIKIKTECNEIYFEETNIVVDVKKEPGLVETLPVAFPSVACNFLQDSIKIEEDDILLEDPLHDGTNYERIEENTSSNESNRTSFVKYKEMLQSFLCYVCKKQFQFKCRLVEYGRNHGERPFICDVCDKRFIRKSDLI